MPAQAVEEDHDRVKGLVLLDEGVHVQEVTLAQVAPESTEEAEQPVERVFGVFRTLLPLVAWLELPVFVVFCETVFQQFQALLSVFDACGFLFRGLILANLEFLPDVPVLGNELVNRMLLLDWDDLVVQTQLEIGFVQVLEEDVTHRFEEVGQTFVVVDEIYHFLAVVLFK